LGLLRRQRHRRPKPDPPLRKKREPNNIVGLTKDLKIGRALFKRASDFYFVLVILRIKECLKS
jgi:hypothetical protein